MDLDEAQILQFNHHHSLVVELSIEREALLEQRRRPIIVTGHPSRACMEKQGRLA